MDEGRGFDEMMVSPRWLAAGVSEAEVSVGYAASGRGVGYSFRHRAGRIALEVRTPPADVAFHVLLPSGADVRAVRLDTRDVPFRTSAVESSGYVDFRARLDGTAEFTIELR